MRYRNSLDRPLDQFQLGRECRRVVSVPLSTGGVVLVVRHPDQHFAQARAVVSGIGAEAAVVHALVAGHLLVASPFDANLGDIGHYPLGRPG